MDEIIALARKLGNQIASNERTRAFSEAANAVARDSQARQSLEAFQSAAATLQNTQAQGKVPSAEDRKRLSDLEAAMASNEKLQSMMRCQADYLELMHRVNDAIDRGTQEVLSQGEKTT